MTGVTVSPNRRTARLGLEDRALFVSARADVAASLKDYATVIRTLLPAQRATALV